jgi:hypothetical protein
MGLNRLSRALTALIMLTAGTAWGAEISGRSSSQLLWYNDPINGRQTDFAQYLRASATKVDQAGKLSFYGYGRGAQALDYSDGLSGRLYYLYGEYVDLYDKVDIKMGRQFVNYAAGGGLIDGAEVNLKNVGPLGFAVMGGKQVLFNSESGESSSHNYMLGLSTYLTGYPKTDLELSWFRKWYQSDVTRDVLGGTFRQYLFGQFKVYGDARYDLASQAFTDAHAGVKYFPLVNLVLTGEWLQSYPTFDYTSIYSVFGVDRFQQGLLRADYTLNDKVALYGGYSKEYYGDDATAELFHAGIKIRPLETLTADISYDRRQGYGGNLDGGTLTLTWDPTTYLELAGGAAYDEFTRAYQTDGSFSDYAQQYWIGAKYKLARNMAASLRVQDDININYSNNYQGRCIFDYDF